MDSIDNSYLNGLESLKEDDFTKFILKPLFESMGYDRVDFHGGQNERGRDLIAQYQQPPRREKRIVFLQSKKVGDIQNAQTGAKLSQLLHQLRQCCTTKLLSIEGTAVMADEVYLACPEKISTRLTEEIFSELESYKHKVTIYDGPQIIEDIKKFKPELLEKLTSIKDKITSTCNDELINTELLSALKSNNHSELEFFYSDLSFFVGSIDSNYLLHMDVEIINDILHIPKSNWKTVIKEIIKLNGTFDLKINHSNVSDIEKDYQSKLELFESIENKENIRKLNEIRSEIVDIEKNIRISLDSISSYVNTQNQQTQNKLDSRLNSALIEYIKHARQTCTTNNNIESISFLDKTPPHIQSEITKEINWQKSRIDKINQETSLSKTIIKEPSYIVKINKDEIITRINDIKTNYIARVNKINSNSLTLSEIETFLSDTTNDLNLISTLRDSNSIIDKIISLKANKNTDDRVSISPHTIFDTGFDIALYGGAGVGKTTTLQAYSRKKRKNTIIYLPLNRILQKVIKILKTQEDRSFLKDDLIWKIILVSKDITPNEDNIKKVNELLLNKTSLILDGLDEIYSSISEIIPAIAEFKDKRPDIQIIISSRDCVSYLNKIKFLGITLLPFTKIQLDKFILGWLNDDIKAEQLKNSINELNLYDYIKTPLLATITCSLVERGVKIPANECAIYTERFKLLTGEYDQHKNINRQKQSSEILRKCAISLAFMMQQNNIRATSKNEMLGFLVKSLSDHYEKDLLEKCLNELIDPCNLLFFDRLTESYSFGHFRFQEHLATLELKSNRGIDITELTKFDWWRGTLGLYAQDTEFSHLFEDIYNSQGNLFKAQETLEFMINNAPKTKQNGLFYLFNKYKESDYLDDIFIDSSDHYSSY